MPGLPTAGPWDYLLLVLKRRRLFRVEGSSMQPALAEGDGVITARVPGNSPLRVSDIVVAKHPFQTGIVLVKRISAIEDNRFHLLGDRPAESTDSRSLGPFGPNLILGRAVARVPGRSS